MAAKRETITTPVFRLAFANIFQPRVNDLSGKEEYSCVMLFPKETDIAALKNAIRNVARETFPKLFETSGGKWPESLRKPIGNGDEKADEWGEAFKGHYYIRTSSHFKPLVVDKRNQDVIDPDQVYSGCYCRAVVSPYAYDQKGNKGVSVGLVGIQFVRDGEAIGGGSAAARKAFADDPLEEADGGSAADPLEDDTF